MPIRLPLSVKRSDSTIGIWLDKNGIFRILDTQ
jgi:hypothetical protein